jgi:hypothetical protein
MTIRTAALLLCSWVLVACATERPTSGRYDDAARRMNSEATAPQRNESTPATGGTSGVGVSGTTSGSSSTGPLEGERGSTPPGKDRAGDHPSSGAIVDPTGAATQAPIRQ